MTELVPGASLPPLETPPVGRLNVAYMAAALRDPNPIHLDDGFAREAGLPGAIAHGTFTIGYMAAAVSRVAGIEAVRRLKVQLVAPVLVGDRLRVEGTVLAVAAVPGGREVRVGLTAVNQAGVTVGRGEATILLPES